MADPTDPTPPVRARMPDKTLIQLTYCEAHAAWTGTLSVPGDVMLAPVTSGALGKALGRLLEQYRKRGEGRG